MTDEPRSLFVYGTLQPGDVRWPALEPFVSGGGICDGADGSLFDTGLGFPAAVFGTGDTIVGRTYALAHDQRDEALRELDAVEAAVDGLYHRVSIITRNGTHAWAYAYGGGLTLTPIPSGEWFAR